jgi:hypothetical protein
MLSHDEQRAWKEILRRCAREAEEPGSPVIGMRVRRPRPSTPDVVAGGCAAILLVVVGAPVAGLAIAVATVPQWLLWRYWPLLDGGVVPSAQTKTRDVPRDGEHHPSSEPRHRRTPRTA